MHPRANRTAQRTAPPPEHVVPHWYMYPPKSSFGPATRPVDITDELAMAAQELCGIYIHIPFCGVKCSFCSLFTTPGSTEGSIDVYVDHLVQEINQFGRHLGNKPPRVGTVYFGGGTPSLLTDEHLMRIMSALRTTLPFAGSCICSVEFSPETVTLERAVIWREAGFSRASLGVQTFDDALLAVMRRGHSEAAAVGAYQLLSSASFPEINVDLIFGSAGQDAAHWLEDLDTVLRLGATSCTFHPAATHSKTALEHKSRFASVALADKKQLHGQAIDFFESLGWARTSVLSYSRTGRPNPLEEYEADGRPTIGFGVSARSYYPTKHLASAPYHVHQSAKRVIQDYYELVASGELPVASTATLDAEEGIRRNVVLGVNRGHVSLDAIRALDALTEEAEGSRTIQALVADGQMIQVATDTVGLTALGVVEAGEIGFLYSSAAVRRALSRVSRCEW